MSHFLRNLGYLLWLQVFLNLCEELLVPLLGLRDALQSKQTTDNIDKIINWIFSRYVK